MVGKILIVDGVATNRIAFKVTLEQAFYQPVIAADGESCLHLSRETAPDLIMLDLVLPDQSGVSLIKQLRADPATRNIPVLAFAALEEIDTRLQAFQAGADDVLQKSVDPQTLLARIRNLLRARDGFDGISATSSSPTFLGLSEGPATFTGPAVVSLLSNQLNKANDRKESLSSLMTDLIVVQSRKDAFSDQSRASNQSVPDVFLVDGSITGPADGLRLLSELRSRSATRHAAICIIHPDQTTHNAAFAYDMGADDVVHAGISPLELALRLKALIRRKRSEDQLRATVQDSLRLAMQDPLTGLHNRRYAMPHLAAIADQAAVSGTIFAVMVIDLDRFKSVNDRLGHAAGDTVLIEVARRLQANLRSQDLLARIGGEEFLVALPDITFEDASSAADRLCHAVEERPISFALANSVSVTVSIGLAISTHRDRSDPIANIVDRADRALLSAKANGRNKVTISKTAA